MRLNKTKQLLLNPDKVNRELGFLIAGKPQVEAWMDDDEELTEAMAEKSIDLIFQLNKPFLRIGKAGNHILKTFWSLESRQARANWKKSLSKKWNFKSRKICIQPCKGVCLNFIYNVDAFSFELLQNAKPKPTKTVLAKCESKKGKGAIWNRQHWRQETVTTFIEDEQCDTHKKGNQLLIQCLAKSKTPLHNY